MSDVLSALARRARPRVFCAPASTARAEIRRLRLVDDIHLASTPRGANLLLIAGDLDAGLVAPALVAHDALAPPRATVWWRLGAPSPLVHEHFPTAIVVDRDPVAALRGVHEDLFGRRRRGEPPVLADVEPAPWRGVGPYGQGGKGMTGGAPYGRPLAGRADDRDGLKLDQLPLRVGPLFPPFPPGLALDVKLQGDVIQEATLENFADRVPDTSVFGRALGEAVPVRDLEVARARSHLEWLSDAVAAAGAPALAARVLGLSRSVGPGDGDVVRDLEASLRRRGFLRWATRGVGVLAREDAHRLSGPVARASGSSVDVRSDEEAYRRLGFEPVVGGAGDAAARWRQRLAEAARALDLAGDAGDAVAGGSGRVESPRGVLTQDAAPSAALATVVPSLLAGMEWGDAVTAVVSLDLDPASARLGSEAGGVHA